MIKRNYKPLFYIDPQGGSGNLGMYDYELLSRIKDMDLIFFGEKTYDYKPLNHIKCKFWFNYGRRPLIFKGLSYVFTMIRIFLYAFRFFPRAIHIQWIRLPIFDILFYKTLKRCTRTKIIYTVHNILPHKIKPKDKVRYSAMYKLSDFLIVHTQKTKEDLVAEYNISPLKIVVAPHGPLVYEHDTTKLDARMSIIRRKYDLENKTIFSLIGIQSKYKGTDLLIKAWTESKLLMNNEKIMLVIAGKDADKFYAKDNSGNIKIISGRIPDLDFHALIKLSDILVLPYRRIEQSGVLLTILSEHKPYCATEVGELTKPIREANIGWIISSPTVHDIRASLETIVSNLEDINIKQQNIAGWSKVLKMYDWNESALITSKLYNNV